MIASDIPRGVPSNLGYRIDLRDEHTAAVRSSLIKLQGAVDFSDLAPRAVERAMRSPPAAGPTVVILHNIVKDATGSFLPSQNQPRGTCTSRGLKRVLDLLQYAQIRAGKSEKFVQVNHAIIYGLGREVMGMLGGNPNNDRDDGCTGSGVGKGVVNGGNLGYEDTSDPSDNENDDRLACLYGARGVPTEYKDKAHAHLVAGMAAINTFEDAKAAIMSGRGVTVASDIDYTGNQGGFVRDQNGVCRMGGHQWPHQMCAIPGTMIAGLVPKPVENVQVGDSVLTHAGRLRPVTEVFRRPFDGDLVRLSCLGRSTLTVTANHPVLVYRWSNPRPTVDGRRPRAIQVYSELDLELYQQTGTVPVAMLGKEWTKFRLTWVPAGEVRENDYLVTPISDFGPPVEPPAWVNRTGKAKTVPPRLSPDPDLAWLIGLFVADGYARPGHKVEITLAPHEVEYLARCIAAWRKLGLEPSVRKLSNCVRVTVYSAVVADSFAGWFGKGVAKHLPAWVFGGWDLWQVLEGVWAGDGGTISVDAGRRYIVNTSRVLIEQIAQILAAFGLRAGVGVHRYRAEGQSAWADRYRVEWSAGIRKGRNGWTPHGLARKIRKVEQVPYTGEVFNFEVAGDHSYVADGVAVHNCYTGYCSDLAGLGEALLQDQSWGPNSPSGPTGSIPIPSYSFWTLRKDAERQIGQKDSWTFAGIEGWDANLLSWVV